MVEEGVTEPSGMREESECPSDHQWLKPEEGCYVCGATV